MEIVAPARLERLEQWLKALARHTPGAEDEALAEIGSWPNSELRPLWIDVNVLIQVTRNLKLSRFRVQFQGQRSPTQIRYTRVQMRRLTVLGCAAAGLVVEPVCVALRAAEELDPDLLRLSTLARAMKRRGDDNYTLRRGALLHSDIAMLVPLARVEPLTTAPSPGPQRGRMQISDGRQISMGDAAVHWEIARMMLDYVQPPGEDRAAPGRDGMVRQWYRATAAWMQDRKDHDAQHLERARAIFPTDPDILFLSGCQRETYAGPHIQSAVRSAFLPSGVSIDVGSERTELRQAESLFRSALALKPEASETRLRLGHVLALLGRHAAAANELRQAIASTGDTLLVYYGKLFLGAEEQALGKYDAARDAFERAAALYPTAQSPLLALSELARRQGDRPAALRALQRVFDLPPAEPARIDPWWTYHVAQARNVDALLEDLRAPFRRSAL
jgi:tetratricopeptide (TPR) repeat protein